MAYMSDSNEVSLDSVKRRGTWTFVLLLGLILYTLKSASFLAIGALEKSELFLSHAMHSIISSSAVFLLSLCVVYFSKSSRLDISVALAVTAYSWSITACVCYLAIVKWNEDSENMDAPMLFIISCVTAFIDLVVFCTSRYGTWLFENEDERYLLDSNGTMVDAPPSEDFVDVHINVLSVIVFVTVNGWYNVGLLFTSCAQFFEFLPYKYSVHAATVTFCSLGILASILTVKDILVLAIAGRSQSDRSSQSASLLSEPSDPKLAFPADLVKRTTRDRSATRSWSPARVVYHDER